MLIEILTDLFARDLAKLETELEAYKNETVIWKTDQQIANSAGNLCLHLIGNLNAYIGKELGATGYVRNRPLEFSQKDIPRKELVQSVRETAAMIEQVLHDLAETDLEKPFPVNVFEKEMTTGFFLVHLTTHLAYHLGQINYHRRLLDNTDSDT